jgi:type I restriction enzyme, S subunit
MKKKAIRELISSHISGEEEGRKYKESVVVNLLKAGNLESAGRINFSDLASAPLSKAKKEAKSLQQGDLLIRRTYTSPSVEPHCAYFESYPEPLVPHTSIVVLRPNKELVNPRYLFYAISFLYQSGKLRDLLVQGRIRVDLKIENLLNLKVTIPDTPEEQQWITEVLDKSHHVLLNRYKSDELADKLIHSLFLDSMKRDNQVRRVNLQKVVSPGRPIRAGTSSGVQRRPGARYLKADDLQLTYFKIKEATVPGEGITTQDDENALIGGDIVMGIKGKVAATAIIESGAANVFLTDTTVSITAADDVNPFFLYHQLRSPRVHQKLQIQAAYNKGNGITVDQLNQLKIFIPSKEIQDRFAALSEKWQEIKPQLKSLLTLAEQLYASLLNDAMKGRLQNLQEFNDWLKKGMPLSQNTLVSKPIDLKPAEPFVQPPDVKEAIEVFGFLAKEAEEFKGDKTLDSFRESIISCMPVAQNAHSAFELNELLSRYRLPTVNELPNLSELVDGIRKYEQIFYEDGTTEQYIDRFKTGLEELKESLKGKQVFSVFSGLGSLVKLKLRKFESNLQSFRETEQKERDEEIERNPALAYALETDIGSVVIGKQVINILQFVAKRYTSAFTCQELANNLNAELASIEEVTEDDVRYGVFQFLDEFITKELLGQPFTFLQLTEGLTMINFLPAFDVLSEFVFTELEAKYGLLSQIYNDERLLIQKTAASQYLQDLMSPTIMGPDTFTPPRRLFMVANIPKP